MYATLDEFKTWIGSHTSDDDHHLEPVLLAACRYVDYRTGRSFTHAEAATRYYYPSGPAEVPVVDLIVVDSLASDSSGDRTFSTSFEPSEYELLPYTDTSGQPSARYQLVRLWPSASRSFDTSRLVRVVGDFGYATVPSDIRLATLLMASRYWKRHEAPLGILEATDLGTFERFSNEDPDVATLLDQYSRIGGAAGGWVAV